MSRVVNICLNGPFTDGLSYQDNLLPKYQERNGHEVSIIAPTHILDREGCDASVDEAEYVNEDGVLVIRIDSDQGYSVRKRFRTYSKLPEILDRLNPEIVFLHGLQSRTSACVAKWVKSHPGVRLFVDNHSDASNSATNWVSKHIQHGIIWKYYAKMIDPYTERFWGVLPARVDFLIENYGLSREKCDLLVMGADDIEVERASAEDVRKATRERFGFGDSDFVVVTGGKIDLAKQQTLLLMDAVAEMGENVKLLMFGPVVPELEAEVSKRECTGKTARVSWASTSESYDYFAAADVVCFPGRHSVYWEQAAGMGKPLLIKRWEGTDHIDVFNNALFIENDSVEEIESLLHEMRKNILVMTKRARRASKVFLYSNIARRSIENDQ